MKTLLFTFVLLASSLSFAQSGGGASSGGGSYPWSFAGRKAEVKRQSRWSLDEWLATRDRMKWSDMWLALNTPSPYEFFVLGGYSLVPQSSGGKADFRFGAGAYVKIFGLEYDRDQILGAEQNARFHLRLFGYAVQNTNLTLHGGLRFQNTGASTRQTGYLGISPTIYLQKYFGIYALYRYYLSTYEHRLELGPFLDFGPLRLFGNYLYQEPNANGWILGGQLFF